MKSRNGEILSQMPRVRIPLQTKSKPTKHRLGPRRKRTDVRKTRVRESGLIGSSSHEEWKERNHYLVHADAYDFLPTLPTNSVDLILTSPPYWGQRSYGMQHNWEILSDWIALRTPGIPTYEWYRENGGVLGLEPLPDWYIAHLIEIFELARVPLKPDGNLWINLGDTYFARWSSIRDNGRQGLAEEERFRRKTPMGGYRQEKQLLLIPSRFAIGMQDRRWILRNDLIWHKPNVPPRPEKDRLKLAHEHFFHFVKRPKEGRAKYFYDLKQAETHATDVVTYNVQPGEDEHTATFPPKLIEPRILSSSPIGGVVLDPFCGTGRTLLVAAKNGRKGWGCDLVASYALNAKQAFTENGSNGEA